MTAGVKVVGLDQLEAGLRRAGLELRDLTAVHPKVAALVAHTTQPPIRSGRLAGSIRADVATGQAIVTAGGAAAPYAGIIEYGSKRRNITGRHYMREGLQRSEPGVLKIYADELQAILNRAA